MGVCQSCGPVHEDSKIAEDTNSSHDELAEDTNSSHNELAELYTKLKLYRDIRERFATRGSGASVKRLFLERDNVSAAEAATIGELLCTNTTLQILSLGKNKIRDDGAAAIGEGLGMNSTLQTLDLRENNIHNRGAIAIAEGLGKNAMLQELHLGGNNISDDGAAAIGKVISWNTTLEKLYLGENNINNEGAAAISEGLRTNTSLRHLSLHMNSIADGGAVAIGESLAKNATLQMLTLGENYISDHGASAIGEGLSMNGALQELYLHQNNIADYGAIGLCEGLFKNATLRTLTLSWNKITRTGVLALAKAFRLNEHLTELDSNPEGIEVAVTVEKTEIGRGEFGTVFLATTEYGTEVVQKKSHGTSHREEIYERLILQGLPEHQNIVRLLYICWNDTLLLEAHKGGSLKNYARMQEGGTPLLQFLSYSHGMCLAIEHLHRHGIVHRDIALRNYVLTEDLQTPVLVDFGLSWPIEAEKSVAIREGERMPYRQCAPEVLSAHRYSKAGDIWQLGLAMWQLLQRGRQPFKTLGSCEQMVQFFNERMVRDKRAPLSCKNIGASPVLMDTVKEVVVLCCKYEPLERPTATQLVKKIEALEMSVEVQPDEKEVMRYKPDIESGLYAYNYTNYEETKTRGRRNYVDMKKDLQENECENLDDEEDQDQEYDEF